MWSFGLRPVADPRPVDFALQQASVLEHLEVLRDGSLSKRQLVDDVTANAAPAPAKETKDGHASRMP